MVTTCNLYVRGLVFFLIQILVLAKFSLWLVTLVIKQQIIALVKKHCLSHDKH